LFLIGLASKGRGHTGVAGRIVSGMRKMLLCRCLSGGDARDLVYKTALLKGELAEAHRSQEVAEERFHRLMNCSSEGARWLVAFEAGCREQFKERSLL
jgi:hypothetical protein